MAPTPHSRILGPLAAWAIDLLVHGLAVWIGPLWLGHEWEERKIAEILAREKIRVLSTEEQLAQAQLRLLQAQIEPHFLFNTLANAVSLIETAPTKASTMLEHFIAYLRSSLAASRSTEGTVGQEAELLRNYLELLKIRMGDRLLAPITDDGMGFRPGANAGAGLQNLRERLAVLYDGSARLVIRELEKGTDVLVELPLST